MDLGFTDDAAGGRGMGLAAARRLAEDGVRVALVGRTRSVLDSTARDLTDRGSPDALGLVADTTDAGQGQRVFDELNRRWSGELNVLIDAVGPGTQGRSKTSPTTNGEKPSTTAYGDGALRAFGAPSTAKGGVGAHRQLLGPFDAAAERHPRIHGRQRGFGRVRRRVWELEKRRAHVPWVTSGTTAMIARSVDKFGSPELKAEVMPGVFSGHVRLCLGYTEPNVGSDVATCKTRALRDGDGWVINGSKMVTTGAHNCQYVFLITNTDQDAPKHKSLTMFLVPLDSPGIEIQGIRTVDGDRTTSSTTAMVPVGRR